MLITLRVTLLCRWWFFGVFFVCFTEDKEFVYGLEMLNSQARDDREIEVTGKLNVVMLLVWL